MFVSDVMAIDPPFRERLVSAGLDTVPRVLAAVGDHLAAWSRTSDAIRVDLPGGAGAVFVKRYHYPRWKHRWRSALRGSFLGLSRARAEYRNLARMRQAGIHAVRPVAWGERRVLHFVRSCFLITEGVPDAVSLSGFVKDFARREFQRPRACVRHDLIRQLAYEIRRMHDAGFVHQDLFWRNVLVRRLADDRFEFYFLDTSVGQRVRLKWLRRDKVVRDLAALSVLAPDFCTRADQLRFMRTYLDASCDAEENRAWLLDVQRHWGRFRDSERLRFERGQVFEPAAAGEHADDACALGRA